jgi:hypothetical protein
MYVPNNVLTSRVATPSFRDSGPLTLFLSPTSVRLLGQANQSGGEETCFLQPNV